MKRLLALLLVAGCSRPTLVGSLTCSHSSDCSPPSTVCGPDGRCVPGCAANPDACVGGATCDTGSGECTGGPTSACSDDSDCDPPDLVCQEGSGSCVAGCTVGGACAAGFRCDPATGRCCDGASPDCPDGPDAGQGCNTDSECVGAPANICSGGACVPGCASAGCSAPLVCDESTGHCAVSRCSDDDDCDDGSYCTQAHSCTVLAFGGKSDCAGGTVVYYRCAIDKTPADFTSCAGAPGPGGCPYCIDHSCYHPGLCASDNDCHGGDRCVGGLCFVPPSPSPCPTLIDLSTIVNGQLAAGKEVCVRGMVTQARSGYDGMNELKLDSSPFLYVDVSPMYASAGVPLPAVGAMVTVHGTVRWDEGHADFELLPVDFISQ